MISMPLLSLAVTLAVRGKLVALRVEPLVGVCKVTDGGLSSGLIIKVRWARPIKLSSVIAIINTVLRPEKEDSKVRSAVRGSSGFLTATSRPSIRKRTSLIFLGESTSALMVVGLSVNTVVLGSVIETLGKSSAL